MRCKDSDRIAADAIGRIASQAVTTSVWRDRQIFVRSGHLAWIALAALTLQAACGGCGEEKTLDRAKRRLWGRQRVQAELEAKAKEAIDVESIDTQAALKDRVLSMSFDEVIARMGFVEYQGVAKFKVKRNKNALTVYEDTLIEHGLHGSFRIFQKDAKGKVLRETIFNNEVLYGRTGEGKMRVQGGTAPGQPQKLKAEAWQPLKTFTSYYGERLALRKVGPAEVASAPAVRYEFMLVEGPDLISVKGMRGAKRPKKATGDLYIDRATGAPVKASFEGLLEIPPKKEGGKPGTLELSLKFTLKPVEGKEIKPEKFEPVVKRQKVNLDPLAFLDGGTRTSTVIGGPKKRDDSE